jgi:predicted membrane protein
MNKNLFSLIFGVALIIIGANAALQEFGFTQLNYVLRTFWPLLLIALAASRFAVQDVKGGVIMGTVGLISQLNALGITNVNLFALLFPALLIFIGVSTLLKSFKSQKGVSDAEVTGTTIFSAMERQITSQEFSLANLVTFFGGFDLDLRKAKMKPEGATIDILVGFGGGELKVSPDVKVEMDVTALFGGSEDKRDIADGVTQTQTLRVKGYVLFGALEVK